MVGLLVFSNFSGLGIQSRRLCYMLKPNKILAIDSSGFSKNKEQHWDWYSQFTGILTKGFPTNREIDVFLKGLTKVFCIENPLNFHLLDACKQRGIKLYIQSNYEFADHLNKDLTLPTKFLMPSYWMIDEMKRRFGSDKVMYLPPPINPSEFTSVREHNFRRLGKKYLHIIGTLATHDRNGTLSILEALKYSKGDFELTIRSQHELPREYMIDDKRVRYEIRNTNEVQEMYHDFDAVILPRRYGGLSLVCNEALMCGLPVIMTDISPNNQLLPKKWLIPATKTADLMTRTIIPVYSANVQALAEFLDNLDITEVDKIEAFELAYNEFSETELLPVYNKL